MWTDDGASLLLVALLLCEMSGGVKALKLLLRVAEPDHFQVHRDLLGCDNGVSCASRNESAAYDAHVFEGPCSHQPQEVVLELRDFGSLLLAFVGLVALMTVVTSILVQSWMLHPKMINETVGPTAEQCPNRDVPSKQPKAKKPFIIIPEPDSELAHPTEEDPGSQNSPLIRLGSRCRTGDRPFIDLGPGVKLQNIKQTWTLSPTISSPWRGLSFKEGSSFILFQSLTEEDEHFQVPIPRPAIDPKPPGPPKPYPIESPFEDPSKWPDVKFQFMLNGNPEVPQLIYNIQVDSVPDGWRKEGGHGVVKEGIYDDGRFHHRVVVKSLRPYAPSNERRALKREINILTTLPPHPNIVKPFGFSLGTNPHIVLEFLDITLYDLLEGNVKDVDGPNMLSSDGLTYKDIIKIMLDVVSGLEHLHQHEIVHNDIKEANIMLDESLNAKIIDFGLAEHKSSGGVNAGGQGTVGYLAPQRHDGLEDRDDVFSLGVVIWNCITAGCDPSKLTEQLSVQVGNSCRCDKGSCLPEPLTQLIHECWRFERGRRPRLATIRGRLEQMRKQSWIDRTPREDLSWAVSKR